MSARKDIALHQRLARESIAEILRAEGHEIREPGAACRHPLVVYTAPASLVADTDEIIRRIVAADLDRFVKSVVAQYSGGCLRLGRVATIRIAFLDDEGS